MNITVDDDIPGLMATLAGGQRKVGDYLTRLIRREAQAEALPVHEVLADHEARIAKLEAQAAHANNQK